MKYTKMLKLSLIFLSLANAVAKRRENLIQGIYVYVGRVAIIILLYSSIVGYDSLAIRSIGRRISIYGGLFHSRLLQLIINYIKESLFNLVIILEKLLLLLIYKFLYGSVV
jgi:hypothetical protein